MERAGEIQLPRRAPNAAWAWEGLRRNPDYRRAYFAERHHSLTNINLTTGATLLRMRSRHRRAEKFGLLAFADPRKPAIDADIFWCPHVFSGCLDVRLSRLFPDEVKQDSKMGAIYLHRLQTRRVLLETMDGARHIVLNGHRFWIQLFCGKPNVIGDTAHIGIRMNAATTMERHLDTASQLLSLYRNNGGKLQRIGRHKNIEPLQRALTAYDIWTGFERPKGSLKDIAAALVGPRRVDEEWNGTSRCLKDMARRARDKGMAFVTRDYLDMLGKKTL